MSRIFTKNVANYMSLGVSGLATILSGKGVFSVSAKIKIATVDTATGNNVVLSVIDNGVTSGMSLGVEAISGIPKVRVSARSVNTDAKQTKIGATTISTGVDAYIGAIVDVAGDTLTVYLNGSNDGSSAVTFNNTTWTLGTPTGADTVGGYLAPPVTTDQFDGEISEIAIWDIALSGANWTSLAGGTPASSVASGNLVYYLPIAGVSSPEPPTVGTPQGTITGSLPPPTPPASGVVPGVFVEVELAGFGSGWTNIAADVVIQDDLRCRIGIDGSGPADLVAGTGTLTFSLRNDAGNSAHLLGYYSPYHANKRSGWGLGIGCRVRLQDPATSTFWTRFVGRIDAIDPLPGKYALRRVRVTAVDWMDESARWTIPPEVGEQVDKRWDEILTAILAQMPRQPTATSFDVGTESYTYALDSGSTQLAMAEFAKLAASEFGPIYQKANGTLRAEGRHARLLDTTSDWTLSDTEQTGLTLPSTRDDVINRVVVTSHPKIVDASPTTVVYSQANVIDIPAGTTKMLLGAYRDPLTGDAIGATDVQPQIAGVDYEGNLAADGSGTNVTADLTITVTAGPAGARFSVSHVNAETVYLTVNELRGRGIYDRGTQQFEAKDTTSIGVNGEHVVNFDMPYQDVSDVGQGAANYILQKYSTAFAQARTMTVIADTSTILTQVLTRDISDRLTIAETVTGLSSAFFINGIEWHVLPTKHLEVTYTLAPAADPFAGLYWILGTGVLGTSTIPAPF